MQEILVLYKEVGETPLACLERFRAENAEYKDVSMTYAGRLDPMAEGLLLVLAGSKVYEKDAYLGLAKTYEAEIVFGMATDTYDILGIPILGKNVKLEKSEIENKLKTFVGKRMQKYPPYSSKPVNGTPMFALARAGELEGKEIPEREVEITKAELTDMRMIQKEILLTDILLKIQKVVGDFRQEEIVGKWKELLHDIKTNGEFVVITCTIECSSGTYIRSIAEDLGVALGTSATLLYLKRTRLGKFEL